VAVDEKEGWPGQKKGGNVQETEHAQDWYGSHKTFTTSLDSFSGEKKGISFQGWCFKRKVLTS